MRHHSLSWRPYHPRRNVTLNHRPNKEQQRRRRTNPYYPDPAKDLPFINKFKKWPPYSSWVQYDSLHTRESSIPSTIRNTEYTGISFILWHSLFQQHHLSNPPSTQTINPIGFYQFQYLFCTNTYYPFIIYKTSLYTHPEHVQYLRLQEHGRSLLVSHVIYGMPIEKAWSVVWLLPHCT